MSSVQLARDVYEAFGRGDIPTVLECSPDMNGILPKATRSALTVPPGSVETDRRGVLRADRRGLDELHRDPAHVPRCG